MRIKSVNYTVVNNVTAACACLSLLLLASTHWWAATTAQSVQKSTFKVKLFTYRHSKQRDSIRSIELRKELQVGTPRKFF